MELKLQFQVKVKTQKPISEVFDAVYNPHKLSQYFATGGATAPLKEGTVVKWGFADFNDGEKFELKVEQAVKDELIVLSWPAHETKKAYDHSSDESAYNTKTEFKFEKLNDHETLILISEGGWKPSQEALNGSYMNCQGWMNFACCLKAWLEYGIILRKGFF